MGSLSLHRVIQGDNLPILRTLPDDSARLIYIDPPFNTGRSRSRTVMKAVPDPTAIRAGFRGTRYRSEVLSRISYADQFDDFLAFMEPRLIEAYRILTPDGTLYVHLDYREVHYCRLLLDALFGEGCFLNEIIWAYDYGGRTKRRWPPKHDNILVYVKDRAQYVFNTDDVDREPYMAPGLVSPEKVALGKLPTDVWWHTIVSPTGHEKSGYPTQKPLGILRRIIRASSLPGDPVLDFFAGSGTTGVAAAELGRRFTLIDSADDAIATMRRRLAGVPDVSWETSDSPGERTID